MDSLIVGFINGTLFPLAFAPTLNVEDYFTRKDNCAIKGLVICDDAARITCIEMGWPGSVHENQIWSNSKLYLGKDKYYDHKEYLLDNSAFSTSSVMFPAFKKCTNANLSEEKSTSTPSMLKLGSRVSTALVYLKHCSNVCEVISA